MALFDTESRSSEVATTAPDAPVAVRDRLVLSLDVDDLVEAVRLAEGLHRWFGAVRVGLELFAAAGPEAISTLRHAGLDVFVDLKLSDDPATVYRTARIFGAVGARYLTLHAHAGVAVLQAGVEGLAEGAANAGLVVHPVALAVAVLGSDRDPPPHIVPARVEAAVIAGCGGLLCVGRDLPVVRRHGPGLLRAVALEQPYEAPVPAGSTAGSASAPAVAPGGGGEEPGDRATELVTAGADLLVVGSTVTLSSSPARAAEALHARLLATAGVGA